ncbi:MAG: amidohydrolase family protein [Bacteroidota bacterium]
MRWISWLLWLLPAYVASGCGPAPASSPPPPLPLDPAILAWEAFQTQWGDSGQVKVDLWLQGGSVLDGSGAPAQQADVLVKDQEIIFVGKILDSVQASQILQLDSQLIAPGFIDPHAHGDPVRAPAFQNFLAQGVTTIFLGQDGFSTPTRDFGGWLERVAAKRPGPNIGSFVGHGTLREMSGVGYRKVPSEAGLNRMKEQLAAALEAGAFGMSTGLEYTPGTYAEEAELLALAKVVGSQGGMIMSHMRNEDDDQLLASIDELLRQGQFCPVHVSHIKSVYGKGQERAEVILARLDSARQQGIVVSADMYPYAASFTGIGIVFPSWAKPPNDFSKVRQLKRAQLETYLRQRVQQRNGPEATLFGTAPYAGKTLAQVANEKGKAFEQVLIEDIGPRGASAAYFVMDESLQQRLLQDPWVMVCSDGSPTMRHPRGYGSFVKVLEQYARQDSLFSLAEAVHKMSGLPARILGLADRGTIEAGNKADLVVFDPAKVQARASFELPHRLASGMEWVIVNGQIVKEGESWTGKRAGQVLRRVK